MRTKSQPTVSINYNTFNSSGCFIPTTNDIIVDDGDCMNAILYHEYRHYLQYSRCSWIRNASPVLTLFRQISVYVILLFVICAQTKFQLLPATIMLIIVGLPTLILETDCNIFAAKRLFKKSLLRKQWTTLFASQVSYMSKYIILPYLYWI